ncbi:MAG: aminodeoxychorismate/anthranilate synthase component II [Schleiferiaceae bacterium]|nr:aminodeoxychorismate/anthranilate synthase component II [Schleiferiaceae bacterium]
MSSQAKKPIHLLILDNYDSFTYNLFHYLEPLCDTIEVHRNDAIPLDAIAHFTHIVISPGPGLPIDAGITMQVLERYAHQKPILGVCLGLQAIVVFFGGTLYNLPTVMHGRQVTVVPNDESCLFGENTSPFSVGLYHSWAAAEKNLPTCLRVTARSETGVIMAIEHRDYSIFGVQFHPESILTPTGRKLLAAFLGKEDLV